MNGDGLAVVLTDRASADMLAGKFLRITSRNERLFLCQCDWLSEQPSTRARRDDDIVFVRTEEILDGIDGLFIGVGFL